MRIGVNLIGYNPGKHGGMENYFHNLLHEFHKSHPEHEYFIFASERNKDFFQYEGNNWHLILEGVNEPQPRTVRILERIINRLNLSRLRIRKQHMTVAQPTLNDKIERYGIDIWHCPLIYLDPPDPGTASSVVVPDIQHEYFPEFFDSEIMAIRSQVYQPSCCRATIVIAISNYVRNTLLDKYHLDPETTFAIPLAAGKEFSEYRESAPDFETVGKKHSLPSRFALYPANTWRHKNHLKLVQAYSTFLKSYPSDLHLVFTGASFEGEGDILSAIDELGLRERIHMLGYVDKEEMPVIYGAADFLIFPSLYEGFGIPLLEAMLMECPIASSNCGSLTEVGGEAAYYFDATVEEEVVKALLRMSTDSELRRGLVEKGEKQISKFSYAKMAQQTLDAFELAVDTFRNSGRENDRNLYYYPLGSDNWFSETSEIAFRFPETIELRVIVNCTVRHSGSFPNEVTFLLEDKLLGSIVVKDMKPQEKIFSVDNSNASGLVRLLVKAENVFIPADLGQGSDTRKLSCRLLLLEAVSKSGKRMRII